ncbi:MAG: hypothetical protein IJ426_01460 [Clostridia bacterium]|nr:hypothetical protein [Clostridia bacterium]
MKSEVLKKALAAIIAFASAVLLALAIIALTVGIVFSKPYFSLLTGKSYDKKVTAEVLAELEGYAIPGGLPQDFFNDKLDRGQLSRDIDATVNAAFGGESVNLDSFKEQMKQYVLDYAEEKEIKVEAGEDSTEENIDRLVTHCADEYKRLVNSAFIKFGGKISSMLSPAVWIVFSVAALGAAGLLFVTAKVGKEIFFRIAVSSAGIMLIIFPAYMLIFRNIASLGITSPSMYALATGIIYSLLVTMVVLAVILLVFANIPYKKRKKAEE